MLLLGWGASAQADYYFCVQSDEYKSFKAHVHFKSFDFGEMAARKILENELALTLEANFQISTFSAEICPCKTNCKTVEVHTKDWNGNFGETELTLGTAYGSAVEIADVVIGEGKALFEDPGGYLMTRFFGKEKKEPASL